MRNRAYKISDFSDILSSRSYSFYDFETLCDNASYHLHKIESMLKKRKDWDEYNCSEIISTVLEQMKQIENERSEIDNQLQKYKRELFSTAINNHGIYHDDEEKTAQRKHIARKENEMAQLMYETESIFKKIKRILADTKKERELQNYPHTKMGLERYDNNIIDFHMVRRRSHM